MIITVLNYFIYFKDKKYFMRGVQTEEMILVSNVCIIYPKYCSCYFQEYSYILQTKLKELEWI